MLADFKYIYVWWSSIFFLSLLSLPLIFLLFQRFWDKGYIFAKTVSLFLISYLLLFFGILHLLPFTLPSIYIITTLVLFADFYVILKNRKFYKNIFYGHWKIFLFEEILFFIILMAWSYIRGFAPDIEGLEKFMDWGFVNSILKSQYFPPADMWYAGESINYYYFGHLVFAFLTKFSGITSTITYNLSIATVCALTFVSGFSITSNLIYHSLKKPSFRLFFWGGILSALLLTFGGNLHPTYKIGKKVFIENQTFSQALSSYWYPDATRFIGHDPDTDDKTIHEFPIYSFVVADLHGHLNDIPLVLFFISFIFVALTTKSILSKYIFIPIGLLLSIAYMTNAWDFAVYGLFFGISSLLITKNFWKTIITGILSVVSWFLFTLPFSLNFTPMAEGVKFSDTSSPFYQLFILYGGFWLISLPFIYFFYLSLREKKKDLKATDYFVVALFVTATILIIIPEIIYIKDIYISEYRRANTMFKLVYQAFIMYSLISGYVLIRLRQYFLFRFLFSLIFIIHLSFSVFSVRSYYNSLKTYRGLWGLEFLEKLYPDNLKAINWLNENITGQPVIVEAAGDSYTTFNQVSMATGLPTIEGWLVHEWLWRGGYDGPGARVEEVEKIYNSQNIDEINFILKKYKVKYIFVGDKEYEKFPDLNLQNFNQLGAKVVFSSGRTYIYQLP